MSSAKQKYKYVPYCPDCHTELVTRYDYFRDETTCARCGLVLAGYPHYGVVYPPVYVRKILLDSE